MATITKTITTFFTSSGQPATGLSPVIRIWNLGTSVEIVTDSAMTEVGGGWYKFDFTTYNPLIKYSFRAFGGSGLPSGEQYTWATNESFIEDYTNDLVGLIWEEATSNHQTAGSTGKALDRIDELTNAIKIALLNKHTVEQQPDGTWVLTRFEDDDATIANAVIINRTNGLEDRTRAI